MMVPMMDRAPPVTLEHTEDPVILMDVRLAVQVLEPI
jgi:hypothetical protein